MDFEKKIVIINTTTTAGSKFMSKKWNAKQLGLAVLPTAIAVGATLSSTSPSLALDYRWDVNLTSNGYSATGYVITNTSTPNTAIAPSNILDWNFTLTNGIVTDTLGKTNSTLGYGDGLVINSLGNALTLPQVGGFKSITFTSTSNSSNLYFGYPLLTGLIPNVRIGIVSPLNLNGGTGNGILYTSTTFATGPTPVPWDVSPSMLPVIGVPFFFGLQSLRKKMKFSKTVKITETVS